MILVAHQLLLGDTLMLAGLFAALRRRWPQARIVTTCIPACLPLFQGRPWGVEALACDLRDSQSIGRIVRHFPEGVDLALLPGDNRHLWLARACGARWIRAFDGDRPAWKNILCDETLSWPQVPEVLSDTFARLAGGEGPLPYAVGDWTPPSRPLGLALPDAPYALLHLGAGNPLRRWPAASWKELATGLAERGIQPVWSCGPNEKSLIHEIDSAKMYPAFAGNLDLAGLWHLLAGADLVVCPDSGVAHLAKAAGRPAVCLFGQGSDELFGRGRFFGSMPFRAVIIRDIPCRDQQQIFRRQPAWVRRCSRGSNECAAPVCMTGLLPSQVLAACDQLLKEMPIVTAK